MNRLLVLAAVHHILNYGQDAALDRQPLAPLLGEILGALRGHVAKAAVTFATDRADVSVKHDTALRLGLITNELATDAIKHAFPHGGGHITVRPGTDADSLVLSVADNGIGISQSPLSGAGASLIDSLAKSIHATITIE
jgi:two-component sensor histidine kinase